MASDKVNDDHITSSKKIRLENEHPSVINNNVNNDKILSVKVEPSNSSSYASSSDRSKDFVLNVYPVLNISEESRNNHKPVQFFVTNLSNICSKDDSIQIRMNDSRPNKSSQDNTSHIRPSESLFVRCLLPHCKRLAPLWFKGVSSMREKNREEHRRISASTTCQNQNDWEMISDLINEMNESSETETVVNLLKKLYKELPADTVLWFIKCWLKFPETTSNEEKCALSRSDARGRMRRIDGGKGSDKVWRLDTIVGMMFHGMPMSSTDTNIMVHTCDQELCIRPQHLRFRASSVALVAVLKALQQTGYSIIPPSNEGYSDNGGSSSPGDEFVDISGPFKIEQLQQYRLEEMKPYEQSMGKLNCSSSDISLLEMYPVLKNYYPSYGDDMPKVMHDYKSRRSNTCGSNSSTTTMAQPANDLKRPAKTTSNSTGSPPMISDGNSQQCHSPPHLSGVKSVNTGIAPTPWKMEVGNHLMGTFKSADDSPSSSIFSISREREAFGQAPDLLAEEPYDIKPPISLDRLSSISRVTNESPIVSGSNCGSGKNTPRQPAKKRLEARTPTFLIDDQPDTFTAISSPLENKLTTSNCSISAFRVVPKKNVINEDVKTCDEATEVELDKIFDPRSSLQNGNYHPDGPFLSEATDIDGKCLSRNDISDLEYVDDNSSAHNKTNQILTTPSPFDYLFMAISQNPNLSVTDDQMSLLGNETSTPITEDHKVTMVSSDVTTISRPKPLKSSTTLSAVNNCRFTPEQASVIYNVLRNSPLCNNNPEIIDMLYNMMQQYPCMGDCATNEHCLRPDSRMLRRQIYQQLSKASPQLDCCSHTPILNEISNDDSIALRSSPYQSTLNKSIVFNAPTVATKNKLFSTEN